MANPLFQRDIVTLDVEFIFTPKIEVKLTICDKTFVFSPISSNLTDYSLFYIALLAISFNDTVYTIATNAIQAKETKERMAIIIQEVESISEEVGDRQP